MTADVKLLPLPKHSGKATDMFGQKTKLYSGIQMQDYALANVAHATAPLQAEIEALRAEVRRTLVRQNGEWQARVERLAEALRPLAELDLTPGDYDNRPDSQPIYARNRTAITVGDVRKARAALEQEANDGRD